MYDTTNYILYSLLVNWQIDTLRNLAYRHMRQIAASLYNLFTRACFTLYYKYEVLEHYQICKTSTRDDLFSLRNWENNRKAPRTHIQKMLAHTQRWCWRNYCTRGAHLWTNIIHFATRTPYVDRKIEECVYVYAVGKKWCTLAGRMPRLENASLTHSSSHPPRRICMQIALARLLCTRRPPRNIHRLQSFSVRSCRVKKCWLECTLLPMKSLVGSPPLNDIAVIGKIETKNTCRLFRCHWTRIMSVTQFLKIDICFNKCISTNFL